MRARVTGVYFYHILQLHTYIHTHKRIASRTIPYIQYTLYIDLVRERRDREHSTISHRSNERKCILIVRKPCKRNNIIVRVCMCVCVLQVKDFVQSHVSLLSTFYLLVFHFVADIWRAFHLMHNTHTCMRIFACTDELFHLFWNILFILFIKFVFLFWSRAERNCWSHKEYLKKSFFQSISNNSFKDNKLVNYHEMKFRFQTLQFHGEMS